jgi:uncharacterized protein with PIN domain
VIVDASALIAILRAEPEAAACAAAIAAAPHRRISAGNFLEAAIVIDGSRDPIASRRFDDLVREADLVIEPVTEAQARIARDAYRDFGRVCGFWGQRTSGAAQFRRLRRLCAGAGDRRAAAVQRCRFQPYGYSPGHGMRFLSPPQLRAIALPLMGTVWLWGEGRAPPAQPLPRADRWLRNGHFEASQKLGKKLIELNSFWIGRLV